MLKKLYITLFIFHLICLVLSHLAQAMTYTAASCNQSDVAAVAQSVPNRPNNSALIDGDTVVIPACPTGVNWTGQILVTKAITLQGAGVGQTVIIDASATRSNILGFFGVVGKTTRMTGITFRGSVPTGAPNDNGITAVIGTGTPTARFVIDHNSFENMAGTYIFCIDALGVISNNTFLDNSNGTVGDVNNRPAPIFAFIYNQNWNGGTNSDGSFSDTTHFGTDQFMFIETNTMSRAAGTHVYAITDSYRGARFVLRYNDATDSYPELHGSDSGGRLRGARAMEMYWNNLRCSGTGGKTCSYVANFRSATGVVWNNTTYNYTTPFMKLDAYRLFFPFGPWGQADGTSPYDINDPGSPFENGTASSGSAPVQGQTSGTMTRTGAGWIVNQWVGFSIKKTSACSTIQCASYILSNTPDTITFLGAGDFDVVTNTQPLSFVNGETYQINKVLTVVDQPGRALDTGLTGGNPDAHLQSNDPSYEWNNKDSLGNVFTFNVGFPTQIRSGQHYFANTQMPGYIPYCYPHPLISGIPCGSGGGSPPTPTWSPKINLRTAQSEFLHYTTYGMELPWTVQR